MKWGPPRPEAGTAACPTGYNLGFKKKVYIKIVGRAAVPAIEPKNISLILGIAHISRKLPSP